MRYLYLQKKDLPEFIGYLMQGHRVVAPIKKENQFVFDDIEDASKVCLDYIPTILPPKKYFFRQKEKLGSFKMNGAAMSDMTVEIEPLIVFGVHTCDIEGIESLDAVFNADPPDPYFIRRKKSILTMGYECLKSCDKYATCITMETHIPKAGYDMMITEAGNKFILHINSEGASALIDRCRLFKKGEN